MAGKKVQAMESPCCLGELEEVVGGADHCPLSSDLFEAAQQELAEASGVFDLTKDGLDDLFAQARCSPHSERRCAEMTSSTMRWSWSERNTPTTTVAAAAADSAVPKAKPVRA